MSLILAAIPLVLLLLLLELGWAALRRVRVHRLADSLTDVGCAAMCQVVELGVTAISVGGYAVVASACAGAWLQLPWPAAAPLSLAFAPFRATLRPGPLLAWLGVFLLVDLGQYLVHRLSHRVSVLWACHAVHHSSEELNYTVALRNSSFHGFFIWVFFLPLAVAGIPWVVVATCYGLNVLYQFWLHTRLIGRLGWLELVLNTPSHHRVHHGRNAKYLDRNFAGVLIVWDRLFGTFQAEEDEPDYGTLEPVGSWNPVWANLHGFALIARHWRGATDWRGRLRAVLGPPVQPESTESRVADSPSHPPVAVLTYTALHLTVAVAATVGIVLSESRPVPVRGVVAALVLLSLGVMGGLLDQQRWARSAELVRLLLAGGMTAALTLNPPLAWAVGAMLLLSLVWLGWSSTHGVRWAAVGSSASRTADRLQRGTG